MGNRRSRRFDSPSQERDTIGTAVETPNQGNIISINVNVGDQESLGENNLGAQLAEPSQICNEIQSWTQILEQKNNDVNELDAFLKEVRSNEGVSMMTNLRSEIFRTQNMQLSRSKMISL